MEDSEWGQQEGQKWRSESPSQTSCCDATLYTSEGWLPQLTVHICYSPAGTQTREFANKAVGEKKKYQNFSSIQKKGEKKAKWKNIKEEQIEWIENK